MAFSGCVILQWRGRLGRRDVSVSLIGRTEQFLETCMVQHGESEWTEPC